MGAQELIIDEVLGTIQLQLFSYFVHETNPKSVAPVSENHGDFQVLTPCLPKRCFAKVKVTGEPNLRMANSGKGGRDDEELLHFQAVLGGQ